MAEEKACGDVIVAIAKDSGGDRDDVTEDAFGGMAAEVDGGLDIFDDDSFAAFAWFHARYNSFAGYRDGSRCGLQQGHALERRCIQ